MLPFLPLLSPLALSLSASALPTQLRDAVAAGDCHTVRQALPTPTEDDERLAVGWCSWKTDPDRAIAALDGVGEGPLSAYARWALARAHSKKGNHGAALAALDGLKLPGDAGLEVRLLRGQSLVELGRSLEARPDLRLLLKTSVAIPARYWLAAGGEDRGDTQAAIATYRRVWATSVTGPWAEKAAERLAMLDARVPDYDSEAGRALVQERVKSLQKKNQHDRALPLVLALQDAGATQLGPITLAYARFKGRDYPGAVLDFQHAMGPADEASGKAGPLFDYALATSRTGDYDTAAVIYRRVIAQHSGTSKADFASFKLGYLEYDRNDCAKAMPLFEAHWKRFPESRHLDTALWFHARCAWRTGDVDTATASWKRLMQARPKSKLTVGARYWLARAAGRKGDTDAEVAGLREVVKRSPASGYAWYAASQLDMRFPAKPDAQPPGWPAGFADRPDVKRGEALLNVGLRQPARTELASAVDAARIAGGDAALAAAWTLVAAGDYRGARKLVRSRCPSPWREADPQLAQVCLPRPEGSLVSAMTARYGLDQNLPYAIMTSESALQPWVTSWAGARGLMQLMPVEAERVHAELYPERPYDPDDLYSAPYNASLGTAELGMKAQLLQGKLDGDPLPAVIASYNGGIEAVERWLSAWDEPPEPAEFAEDVGYTETRRYVRGVLGHLMEYRWVYGDREQAAANDAKSADVDVPGQ